MEAAKPRLVITLDQNRGDLSLVGNRDGLAYLQTEITQAITEIDERSSTKTHPLDTEITSDLTQIVVGQTALEDAVAVIEFYRAAPKTNQKRFRCALTKGFAGLIKIIWQYWLPILGICTLLRLFNLPCAIH